MRPKGQIGPELAPLAVRVRPRGKSGRSGPTDPAQAHATAMAIWHPPLIVAAGCDGEESRGGKRPGGLRGRGK